MDRNEITEQFKRQYSNTEYFVRLKSVSTDNGYMTAVILTDGMADIYLNDKYIDTVAVTDEFLNDFGNGKYKL